MYTGSNYKPDNKSTFHKSQMSGEFVITYKTTNFPGPEVKITAHQEKSVPKSLHEELQNTHQIQKASGINCDVGTGLYESV